MSVLPSFAPKGFEVSKFGLGSMGVLALVPLGPNSCQFE
jgi:hypothetical protein